MSHFVVLVLLKSPEGVQDRVEELLEPFDENMPVDEYERECYCVGRIAAREAAEAATAAMGNIDVARAEFHSREDIISMQSLENYDGIEKEWRAFIQPRLDLQDKLFSKHELREKPNPECGDCSGKGTVLSTYNPKSKWDWYVIGGRWNGYFKYEDEDIAEPSCEPTLLELYAHCEDDNVTPVKNIIKGGKLPFAIVTPDGQWHEKGRMGWFALVADENEDWPTLAKNILADYPDHYAVTVDCHI